MDLPLQFLNDLTANYAGGSKPRREFIGGVEHLVCSGTMLVEGVLPGSKGPLFYPRDEIRNALRSWHRIPITLRHPVDPLTNVHLSAKHPGVLDRVGMGFVLRPVFENSTVNRQQAELWFEFEKARRLMERDHAEVWNKLLNGEPVELSTGLYTDNVPEPGVWNGRAYTHVARNYRPDHLAILPDEVGACSIKDGCGVHNAGKVYGEDCPHCGASIERDPDSGKCNSCGEDWPEQTANINPEGCNQHTGPGCSGGDGTEKGVGERHAEAKGRYEAAKAEYAKVREERLATFEGHKEKAIAAKNKADEGVAALAQARDDSTWDDEAPHAEAASALYDHLNDLDEDDSTSVGERHAHHLETVKKANAVIKAGGKVPAWVNKAKSSAASAAKNLRSYVSARKEMRAIKGKPPTANASESFKDDPAFAEDADEDLELTSNDGKYHNPQSKNTGRFKKHGSGTGKGEVHQSAQDGFHGGPLPQPEPECDCGGTCEECQAMERNNNPEGCNQHTGPGCSSGGGKLKELQDAEEAAVKKYDDLRLDKKFGHKHPKTHAAFKAVVAATEAIEKHRGPTTSNTQGETMKLTPEQRAEAVSFLTTNCACWKGEEATLNDLSDDQLAKVAKDGKELVENRLVVNAVKEAKPDLALNAMPAFIKEKMKGGAAEEEEEVEEEEEEETVANKSKPAKSIKERLTAEELEVWNSAERINNDAKKELVKKLVANVAKSRRQEKAASLMKLSYPALVDLAELLPAPTANEDQPRRRQPAPVLNDMAWLDEEPTDNAGANDGGEDVLPLPTFNWAEISKQRQTASA